MYAQVAGFILVADMWLPCLFYGEKAGSFCLGWLRGYSCGPAPSYRARCRPDGPLERPCVAPQSKLFYTTARHISAWH